MDRRWPWKKKSSDKAAAEKVAAILDSAGASLPAAKTQEDQESYKKPNYVQISVESYTHLTGLEEQVKSYEEQVKSYEEQVKSCEEQVKSYEEQVQTMEDHIKELDEQLSSAHSDITTKENLVKQHAKVAEEAVSGWEKAEAEALALKNHLESVTLEKLSVEDRASHLDGALKECMRQIRNLKEEHEQKLQEVFQSQTKKCEKIKHELEAKIINLEQELLRSAAENAALSRSLQERSNMLVKINEEKSRAEAEIELLKSNVESCEREINSLKYEVHVATKELEIRNEEKNMSLRSAEVANKQHMEGVKKIAKLEAECQRLRGLVRKKLPGPAALAQMKVEVESLGRDYGESRLKRSPVKPQGSHVSHVPEYSLDNLQKVHKENEFLTERLLAMEEETKMLKEALAKRNSELQASRNTCAKITYQLQLLESQQHTNNPERNPTISVVQMPAEGFISNYASPPSLTSMSEDGNEDEKSCAGSLTTALSTESSQCKKEAIQQLHQNDGSSPMDLMDDFLEMERLAGSSNASDVAMANADSSNDKLPDNSIQNALGEVVTSKDSESTPSQRESGLEASSVIPESTIDELPLKKLHSNISSMLNSPSKDSDMKKLLKDIRQVLEDAHDTLNDPTIIEEKCTSDAISSKPACSDVLVDATKEINSSEAHKPTADVKQIISQDLASAISSIHEFVLFLGKEAIGVHDMSCEGDTLSQKIDAFSITFHKVLHNETSLVDFVLDLSCVLTRASELRFNILGYKGTETEISSPDCIDKVALPENKVVQSDLPAERYQNGSNISDFPSDPEVPDFGNVDSGFVVDTTSPKISLEEYEQLKSEKENIVADLARSAENLESVKTQLVETEQLLAEVKSQLASALKSNSLSETQLKCMAESYKTLELHAQQLENEVNHLQERIESLDNELQEEKKLHQDALAKCKDLQEQLQRVESSLQESDGDVKTKQEKELAAAAEKLAECQETIILLGKQLNALRPRADLTSLPSEKSRKTPSLTEDQPTTSGNHLQDNNVAEVGIPASPDLRRASESAGISYDPPHSPSDTEAYLLLRSPVNSNQAGHKHTLSGSSSSSSPTPEKQSRSFSRFFSGKGKSTP